MYVYCMYTDKIGYTCTFHKELGDIVFICLDFKIKSLFHISSPQNVTGVCLHQCL